MSFSEKLKTGQSAEREIAQWLLSRGWAVLPVYEKVIDTGKGPQLFLPAPLIAPDLFVWRSGKIKWVESKYKNAFTYHRITGRWTTGIDLRHYSHYCEVASKTKWEVWILFLQKGGQAKDSPPDSPSGLYGQEITYLQQNENHRHSNWGKSGMVYWAEEKLIKLAELDQVVQAVEYKARSG